MEDIKQLMQRHYLSYASYVILDRAIPRVEDGLKPVQRRILHTLWLMHDGKLHKVANVAGQTMALHPHGDAPITEALVNLANKGYLLDRQGNFGNLCTGDPAAAARYIETRLSPLAKEVLFNPDLTPMIPSYDGRHAEPVILPAKIPVVLLQGVEGIAVGMSTHVLPHNFNELLAAEIAILEGKPFTLLPDFPTGGILDPSHYERGRGKVKLRAYIEVKDSKTLVIKEICYGTTTESLIRSIDEAAKKGKLKIESIQDYTAEQVEIEIKLARGHYAQEVLDALYAYTECETTLHSQIVLIKDHLPWETDVVEVLNYHAQKLQEYLRRELEIQRERLQETIFERSLEQIFIQHRLYQAIEEVTAYEHMHQIVAAALQPYHPILWRAPQHADRERLFNIPIRRISRFDLAKNEAEIAACQQALLEVDRELGQIPKVAIRYLQALLKKYGKDYPRRTQVRALQQVDTRLLETRAITVGFDPDAGFIGEKVAGKQALTCTNFDKLLVFFKDGTYRVMAIPEKQYVHHDGAQVVCFLVADKKTVLSVAYHDPNTGCAYAKRFVVDKFILDKTYRYLEEGYLLDVISAASGQILELYLTPKGQRSPLTMLFKMDRVALKGVMAKGTRITPRQVQKIVRLDQSLCLHAERPYSKTGSKNLG